MKEGWAERGSYSYCGLVGQGIYKKGDRIERGMGAVVGFGVGYGRLWLWQWLWQWLARLATATREEGWS